MRNPFESKFKKIEKELVSAVEISIKVLEQCASDVNEKNPITSLYMREQAQIFREFLEDLEKKD